MLVPEALPGGQPDQEEAAGFRYILSQPAFRLVWAAQVVAQLADKFVMFSLVILAYRLSRGSTPVAFTLLAYTVPALAIAPLAGVFADRHDRKTIMWSTNLARAAVVVLIPLASFVPGLKDTFWHLLVITFAFSAAGQLFSPAESAVIPSLLHKRSLLTANSLVLVTVVLTLVLGGALSPIVSQVNLYAPYWWAAGLFGLGGVLVLLAPIPRSPGNGHQAGEAAGHPFRRMALDLKEGVDYLRGSRVLMASFLQLSLAVLVMYMMFTLAPAYASTVLGLQTQETYLIMVPATLGAMLGAGLLVRFGKRIAVRWQMSISMIATGLTLAVLAIVPLAVGPSLQPYIRTFAAGLSFLLGLEFGAMMIPPVTQLMENTVDEVRGRVFALLYMVVNGAIALPVLAAAALSDALGTGQVIIGLGAMLAGAGGLMIAGRAAAGRSGRSR